MGRIQYYPLKRITVNEKKYEQDLRMRSIMNIFNVMNPRVQSHRGVFGSTNPCSLLIDDTAPYVRFNTNSFYGAAVASPTAGLFIPETFGTQTTSSNIDISFTENWKTNDSFFVYPSQCGSPALNLSGWLTVYLLPAWIGEEGSYVYQYVDQVATDVVNNSTQVLDRSGRTVTPYLRSECVQIGDMKYFIKYIYDNNAPIMGKDIASSVMATYELVGIDGTTNITTPYNQIAIELGAFYNNGTSIVSSIDLFSYRAVVGAELIEYNTTAAGETSSNAFQTNASTFQDAIEPTVEIVSATRYLLNTIGEQINYDDFDGIVFLTPSSVSTFASAYTQSTNFPSNVGKRWNK